MEKRNSWLDPDMDGLRSTITIARQGTSPTTQTVEGEKKLSDDMPPHGYIRYKPGMLTQVIPKMGTYAKCDHW
jgi:hypothetical protein